MTPIAFAQDGVRVAQIHRNLLACDDPQMMAGWHEVLKSQDQSAFQRYTRAMMNSGQCTAFTAGMDVDVERTGGATSKDITMTLPNGARLVRIRSAGSDNPWRYTLLVLL